jgi:RNA polymerase-binding transcription factor
MDPWRAGELLGRERDRIEHALARLTRSRAEEFAGQEEFGERQLDDLLAELAAVKHAEERLAAGTFGLSVESGEPIPDERLEAVPTAERTLEEQERFDRQDGQSS